MKQINQNDQDDEIVIYQSKDGKTRLGDKLYASEELYENGTCSILVHRDNDGKQRAQALSDMPWTIGCRNVDEAKKTELWFWFRES